MVAGALAVITLTRAVAVQTNVVVHVQALVVVPMIVVATAVPLAVVTTPIHVVM